MNSLNCAAVRFKFKYLYRNERSWNYSHNSVFHMKLLWDSLHLLCLSCHHVCLGLLPPPSLGVRSTPSCIFHHEIKNHSLRCILKSFLTLHPTHVSQPLMPEVKKQVRWVIWYVLWDFTFVRLTTAAAPLLSCSCIWRFSFRPAAKETQSVFNDRAWGQFLITLQVI